VPVYNSAETLDELCRRLRETLTLEDGGFEVILVDDGSHDSSWVEIRRLAREYPNVRGLQLTRNFGQTGATMAGMRESRGRIIVTIDDDLQNPPEEIPKLLKAFNEDALIDVVIGAPLHPRQAWWRRFASRCVNAVSNAVFGRGRSFRLTSFRALRREVVEPLLELNIANPQPGALLNTVTRRIANVAVAHHRRRRGRSGYTLFKMVNMTVNKLLGFSTFPLRLMAFIGLMGLIFSFGMAALLLVKYFSGHIAVPGWTTLALLLVLLSAFNFLAFGLVGEYLQQILLSVRNMPAFIVRTRTDDTEQTIVELRKPE